MTREDPQHEQAGTRDEHRPADEGQGSAGVGGDHRPGRGAADEAGDHDPGPDRWEDGPAPEPVIEVPQTSVVEGMAVAAPQPPQGTWHLPSMDLLDRTEAQDVDRASVEKTGRQLEPAGRPHAACRGVGCTLVVAGLGGAMSPQPRRAAARTASVQRGSGPPTLLHWRWVGGIYPS